MENRIRLFLLRLVGAVALLVSLSAAAQTPDTGDDEPLFEPRVERRVVDIAAIDTEDFEAGPFLGWMSIEDFGVNLVVGARFAYHISEDLFAEAAIGMTEADETSFELLSGAAQILTPSQRDYTYYNFSLGYNLFQGESYFGADKAFNSSIYLIGGIGSTEFGGGDRFTVNLGVGYRFIATDWLSLHVTLRDHIFDHDLFGSDKTAHNWEATISTLFFF